CARSWGAMDYW
nr:immunoglobulin heavy chain junction region [Mus musculus]